MNIVEAGMKQGKMRHYVDCNKYKRLFKAKALCGCSGNKLVRYDAVFFNYEAVYPKLCKKCEKIYKEFVE